MARYSRHRAPATTHTLTITPAPIPGLAISRFFDTGPLLLLFRCRFTHVSVGATAIQMQPTLDGVPLGTLINAVPLTANTITTYMDFTFLGVAEGQHTIDLLLNLTLLEVVHIDPIQAQLLVLQFPQWDSLTDIT